VSITVAHIKENLCAAHIYAVAGMAGAALGVRHVQDYGVDGQFDAVVSRGKRRIVTGFSLPFQAKATVNWEIEENHVVYDLESKTYNDMVTRTEAESTLLLVLLCLPKDPPDWHVTTAACTTLRNCCYWHLVKGDPVENEKSTKRIWIPEEQLLTPASLQELMEVERARRIAQAQ
jgi:hypothetical protein